MRLLRSIGVWMLVGGIALAVGAARAQRQNSQNSGQQGNGNTGTAPAVNNNTPYIPPAVPSMDASGSYGNGRSSGGSGSGGGYGTGGYGNGQNGGPGGGLGHDPSGLSADEVPQNQQQIEQQQVKARNTERQKQLVADTQRLVALANELQTDVSKSTKDTLSLDVVRKADEIEKLAKTVRDRMKSAN